MSTSETTERTDVAIVGGGAAGLLAAIWAARTHPQRQIVLLDGAKRIGAKILIAGGGRCNVTNEKVTPQDYCGSTPNAIRKVLSRFTQPQTIEFFAQLGVKLKREPTGKLFPVTDQAKTVLEALLAEVKRLGIEIRLNHRVENIKVVTDTLGESSFEINGPGGHLVCQQIVLATGGKSVPKTGSDGHGLELARRLGHELTPQIFPALVPLQLASQDPLTQLSGIALPVKLELTEVSGKRLAVVEGDLLLTHKGLSGPAVLDMSRHWLAASDERDVRLGASWLPDVSAEALQEELLSLGKRTVRAFLRERLPDRLVDHLLSTASVRPEQTGVDLTKAQRKAIGNVVIAYPLNVTGTLGFKVAEVTAGGVPLSQIDLKTMQSRLVPGLYFCGEICDVDGRIGGFNFQWAWSSGYVVGVSL
ncbi:NAD(P)/FAD-dependent oxidoreductase [Blastopirellula marina]|uniref:Aminoacetone oxidase family FAD-binding enzyme n=1 Tax=Blastopirellula marina TaxID=124 RepID=A0A2S8F7Y4_9BACT|nr:NAD(P)/FAD-dependent oxidoreductase [Blastopirellula marina]PQO28258.1 aminoacetone oxidase family FAD-binding enzyme [Blastopirellula marina]PTL41798.1 NAD(P)/FAD-dependent oxidoreductase [Blastopirellula marina]